MNCFSPLCCRLSAWLLLIVTMTATGMGCAASRGGYQPQWTSMLQRSAKIPASSTKEEIVDYVNQHITPIQSWRATNATLQVSGMPAGIRLSANMVVEQPNHFRMMVCGPLSSNCELDLGSNQEKIWFYMRQMEPPAVITCRHEEIAAVQDQLPVPFQPEWLMQVMCVEPINGDDAELIRDPDNPYFVKLVSHHTNDYGHTIRKTSTIDLRKGEVTKHQLFDSNHQLIATATLSDYREFPNTKARLPHDIVLKWEQQNQKMHISLNGVEINPPNMPTDIWNVPVYADCPVHELHREQLLQPASGGTPRSLRDKPKAITHYELDPPSGAWLQEQKIQPAKNSPAHSLTANASPARPPVNHSLTQADPFSAHEFPPVAQSPVPAQPVVNSAPAGRVSLSDFEPPPFPAGGTSPTGSATAQQIPTQEASFQTTQSPEWAQPATMKKSRETLIDGVPTSEFEPPVTNSAAN